MKVEMLLIKETKRNLKYSKKSWHAVKINQSITPCNTFDKNWKDEYKIFGLIKIVFFYYLLRVITFLSVWFIMHQTAYDIDFVCNN